MANVKITNYDPLTTPAATDLFEIVDDVGGTPTSKKIAWQHLFATALPLTSGQIAFPGTAVPSADANTLDDYEEGTWTLAMTCGTSGTITMNNSYNTGAYTKVAREVTVTGWFAVDSVSSPVGQAIIGGLPFACASGLRFSAAAGIQANNFEAGMATQIQVTTNQAASTANFFSFAAGVVTINCANTFRAGSDFTLSLTYFTT